MSIATDILAGIMPNFAYYLQQGDTLDDYDEYGFTPLIEAVLAHQLAIAKELLKRGVEVDKTDMSGRTALHWAVDNNDIELATLLLEQGANANSYAKSGLSILVYPLLREQESLKQLLYQYGAQMNFAYDFIYGKLIGHRYDLNGTVDILNPNEDYIELDYEGFILEFTVAILRDSLRRFTSSYSTKHLRHHFPFIYTIIDAFELASNLLKLQHQPQLAPADINYLSSVLKNWSMLVLPAASTGHALGFIAYKQWWGKIDRGENSLKEGTVNLYKITKPEQLNIHFLQEFLYKKQPRNFFHQKINDILGLQPVMRLPISPQITGNCSWANIQAIFPVAYAMQQLFSLEDKTVFSPKEALSLYHIWVEWDKDRALDECIHRFYIANNLRKISFASMMGAILYQSCDYEDKNHMERAEKILAILSLPEYYFILKSYLDIYCVRKLTRRGNNLLKILDEYGINPNIGITPIATGLKDRLKDDKE